MQDGCRGCVDLDSEWHGCSHGDGKPIDFGPVKNPVAWAAHHLDRVAELPADVFLRIGMSHVDIDQRRAQCRLWLGLKHDGETVDVRWHFNGVHCDAGRELAGGKFQRAAKVAACDLQHGGDAVAPWHRHHLSRLCILCTKPRDECRQFRSNWCGLNPVNVVRAALAEMVGNADEMFAVGGQRHGDPTVGSPAAVIVALYGFAVGAVDV